MTLPTSTRVTDPYETDGVQRDFEFDFPAFYNADTGHYGIEVRRLTALDYEVIDKSLYDIFLNDEDKSGYIRFHVAPMAGDDIYIAGDTTRSQQLNLINYGRYSAQSIEKAFDLIVALIQEFVSKVDEETRQRILADQALRDFLLIKFNQFTAEVTTKIDKHIGDINGFMSSLIPMFVCIMRKEIANYAETQLDGIIDAKLSDLSIQVANAINENDAALIRLNESIQKIDAATTATAIGARLFDTPAAGVHPVTGVPVGSYFNVRSSNADSYVDEYRNVGGSAVATGKSYPSSALVQDVRIKAPYFFNTVSAMVAANNISDGMIVGTKGYHNISDNGGAIYLISAAATGYSIPLANGLHAVFRDTFDIRKFGIVSSPTLDQTTNLLRMRNYADERIYEIDLLGFDLLSPKSINYTSARGSILRGLYFHRPHKIKNAKFYHDKNEQLVQGSCPIQFTPKTLGNGETFELENIDFDIYIQNHLLISGEGDGRLHGFYAGWHPDYPVGWPANVQTPSGYKFKATNINSVTAGITSTLALGIQFNKTEFYNLRGDYIGYYSTFNGADVTAKNCHAVYRADLHAAGRLLVTNQFQFEPEVEDLIYTLNKHVFEDLVCITNTGVSHNCVKYEKKGVPTFNELKLKNVSGQFAFSASSSTGVRVLNLDIDNVQRVFNLPYRADKIRIKNSPILDVLFTNTQNIDSDIVLTSCEINSAVFYTGASINNVKFVDCTYNAGICRSPADIKNIVILGGLSYVHRVLEADFESLTVEGNFTYSPRNTVLTAVFLKVGTKYTSSRVTLNHNSFETLPDLLIAVSTALVDTQGIEARVYFNDFKTTPTFRLGNSGFLDAKFNSKQLTGVGSKTYAPPSLPNAAQQSTTVTLTGAKLGDNISVAFDKALSGTRMWGEVTSANTVTVYHRNDTGAEVVVPSGTLTVKLI